MFSILINTLKKMFVYKGRSSNKEYLVFTIFEIIIFLPLYIYLKDAKSTPNTFNVIILILSFSLVFTHFFTYMSLTIRRLHDCNLKGWWYILNFIFSPFVFIILCFLKGTKGSNKYGEEPKN